MHSVMGVSALLGPAGRAVRMTMATGARMIERQEGYPPGRLMVGGLVAWGLCLGLMLAVAGVAPVLRYATGCLALHCLG